MPTTLVSRGWSNGRAWFSGAAAAAAVSIALVLTPQGQQAAASFLAQFRSEKLQPISLTSQQIEAAGRVFSQLERIGTVQQLPPASRTAAAEVKTVEDAGQRAGFAVKQPDPTKLPAGVDKTPRVQYVPGGEGRFTFDQTKARAYFDSVGRADLSLPAKLHGATLIVRTPPGVLLTYPSSTSDGSSLLVGQTSPLTMDLEGGATLEELREFLLKLPGVSPELAAQIRSIPDWQNTVPLPIPVDRARWEQTTIGGAPALILNDNSGIGSGVLWQKDDRVYGVAGGLKVDDVRRVAESLR